jgi:hypothetical protein
MSTQIEILFMALLFIGAFWSFFATIGSMARDRGQSPWTWWMLSLFWSPFGSIAVMWFFFRKRPAH